MAARRKAVTNSAYKFLTLESECGAFSQISYASDDDSFMSPESAVTNASSRLDNEDTSADAIYIVEVIGVVKKNKAAYTPIGTKSVHDLEG
jgi:hypothetical protein